MNIILKDLKDKDWDMAQYEVVMASCIQKLKESGSKRTQTGTSVKKLREVIEEMARFMGRLSMDNRFKSKNRLCIGYAITQPLLSTHFQKAGISIHHNVVHDLINQFCIRDHSYCTSDERAHIYTKTTVDWDNEFKYIISEVDKGAPRESNAWKLKYLKDNPHFKVVVHCSLGDEPITINDWSPSLTTDATTPHLAIIGRLPLIQLHKALEYTHKLIHQAHKLLTPAIKSAKIWRLQKIETWLQNCIYNEGLYLDIYQLSSCGRQYGLGTTLQNINREIRRRILKHNLTWDQRGSHLNILRHQAQQLGLPIAAISQYLNMTEEELHTILKEAKMHRKSFKLTVLAMINGYTGDKIQRHQFLQRIFSEIHHIQKTIQYTTKDLFEAERHITTQQITHTGLQNILSLEFDGFTSTPIPATSTKTWKIKRL